MPLDTAHNILGFVPESEKGSIGPISARIPALTGAHYYPGYKDQLSRVLFLEACYKGGPAFKHAVDRSGEPVFVKHERESEVRYQRRKRLTTYRNYVGPIVDSFANYVMSTPPQRSKRKEFVKWTKNVDRRGSSLHAFMKNVLIKATLIGRHWVGVDLPRAEDGTVRTIANDTRTPYLVSVSHANIVDFELDREGQVTRIVIHHEVYKKSGFAQPAEIRHEYHEWNSKTVTIWKPAQTKSADDVMEAGVVTGMPSTDGKAITIPKPGFTLVPQKAIEHGYDKVPFFCVETFSGKGVAEDIAEANKTVLNLVGLLYEELYNNTFSQTYISGIGSNDADDVKFGTQTIIFLPSTEAKVHTTGAEPEQARSIMNALFNEVKEIHRMAHMEQSGEPLQKRVAEAASKKEKDSESMDQVLESMAEAMEIVERCVLSMVASFKTPHVNDKDIHVKYSRVFDTKTLREKISLLVDLDKAPYVPAEVVKGVTRMIIEEVLEEGPEAEKTIANLKGMTDSTSPQGLATLNFKVKCGIVGPVEVYKIFNPSVSDEEARKALTKIREDRETFAVEHVEEESTNSSDKPSGRPEKQPTPEERRKAKEQQQAANQA